MIVVDTSVLSLAFRRRRTTESIPSAVARFREAVVAGDAVAIPGIVLQELLSGLRTSEQFDRLARLLAPFPLLLAAREHHLEAARLMNACRAAGLVISQIDSLIAALTIANRASLLTTDQDFARMARHCRLRLVLDS